MELIDDHARHINNTPNIYFAFNLLDDATAHKTTVVLVEQNSPANSIEENKS